MKHGSGTSKSMDDNERKTYLCSAAFFDKRLQQCRIIVE